MWGGLPATPTHARLRGGNKEEKKAAEAAGLQYNVKKAGKSYLITHQCLPHIWEAEAPDQQTGYSTGNASESRDKAPSHPAGCLATPPVNVNRTIQ